MGRQPSFRIAEIAELFRQLRVVSASVRTRAMNAAEELIGDVDPARNYPLDFVVFRITGFRSQQGETSATLVGEILVGDLATLVQRLSASIELPADADGRQPLVLDEVARRLNVSKKTVQRYRKAGLVCHEVELDGSTRVVCFADALQRFAEGHRAPLNRAASFTRISDAMRSQMIEQAQSLRQQKKLSLNEAAKLIAATHGRAHETVRSILKRHDRKAQQPIFTERGPLTQRDHRMILRAHERGMATAAIARHVGRSRKAVHRSILRQRAQRLRDLPITYVELETFSRDDASQVLLSPAVVRSDLYEPELPKDALELLTNCRAWLELAERDELALLGAYNFLKHRAAVAITELQNVPSAADVDAVETDLRWAALVKRKLVLHGMAVALQRVEQNLHRSLATAPRETVVTSIVQSAAVASRAIETVNPQKDQHVARVCGYAMERTLAAAGQRSLEAQAAARHEPGTILMDDPLRDICPWQDVINRPVRWFSHLQELDPESAELVALHYGFGGPPVTCVDIAAARQTTASAVARAIDAARQQLRAAALRDADGS